MRPMARKGITHVSGKICHLRAGSLTRPFYLQDPLEHAPSRFGRESSPGLTRVNERESSGECRQCVEPASSEYPAVLGSRRNQDQRKRPG